MPTLNELLAQKAELDKQIETIQSTARSDAIAQVKTLMADHGLSVEDVIGKATGKTSKSTSLKGKPVAAKYRNEATGESWSGRGIKPKWLQAEIAAGKQLEDFTI